MQDIGITGDVDYQDRLEIDPDEFAALFNTILINVTGFWRDTEAWAYLQREVVPELLGGLDAGTPRMRSGYGAPAAQAARKPTRRWTDRATGWCC
jgi:hypothetical protein